MIEEITWETFDERTRVWMQVLSNIPVAPDDDGLIDFIEKYRAGKTDEEWEAARPVMVTNDGPEPKDVGEHA